jgi:hypothetical protein
MFLLLNEDVSKMQKKRDEDLFISCLCVEFESLNFVISPFFVFNTFFFKALA